MIDRFRTNPTPGSGFDNAPISTSPSPGIASQTGSATTPGQGPDPKFVAATKAKLEQMIGSRYYLVDDAALNALATKLWQNVGVQQAWEATQSAPTNASLQGVFLTVVQATVLNSSQDPSVDPSILSSYIDLKQSAGESLTTAELAALSNSTQALTAVVPKPFDTSRVSGYDWGQPLPADLAASTGWKTHQGVDYGTPAGSRIVSPFAGTIEVKHDPWRGNQVLVHLDNGYTLSFGHVANAAAQNGTRVNPGDLIAISGQNVGISKGAVTLVEVFDPKGAAINPHDLLDPIFQGTTFASFPNLQGAQGTGMATVNSILDREYPSIKSDWQTYFGSPPSPEDVYNVLAHGTSPEQWRDYMRSFPGHIEGMNVGQAYDLRSLADNVSMNAVGHLSTDGIVKELFDQGMTGQSAVKFWYDEHSPNEIDKTTYNQIYQASHDTMVGVFNEQGMDPRIIKSIHDSQPGHPGPQEG